MARSGRLFLSAGDLCRWRAEEASAVAPQRNVESVGNSEPVADHDRVFPNLQWVPGLGCLDATSAWRAPLPRKESAALRPNSTKHVLAWKVDRTAILHRRTSVTVLLSRE
jgi:hypothetical protein